MRKIAALISLFQNILQDVIFDRSADKGTDHLHRHFGITQPLHVADHFAVELRPAVGNVKPAIGREARQQDIGKRLRTAAAARGDILNHGRISPQPPATVTSL